jgi:hypothetical protein
MSSTYASENLRGRERERERDEGTEREGERRKEMKSSPSDSGRTGPHGAISIKPFKTFTFPIP